MLGFPDPLPTWHRSDQGRHMKWVVFGIANAGGSRRGDYLFVEAGEIRIKPSELVSEGRVYGGGLHKVEPNELAQIPARLVLESLSTHLYIEQQERLFA